MLAGPYGGTFVTQLLLHFRSPPDFVELWLICAGSAGVLLVGSAWAQDPRAGQAGAWREGAAQLRCARWV